MSTPTRKQVIDWGALEASVTAQTNNYFSNLPPPGPLTNNNNNSSLMILHDLTNSSFHNQNFNQTASTPTKNQSSYINNNQPSSPTNTNIENDPYVPTYSHSFTNPNLNPNLSTLQFQSQINQSQHIHQQQLESHSTSTSLQIQALTRSERENSTNVQELYSQLHSQNRTIAALESNYQQLQHKMQITSQSIDYANSISTKHQVWISQADAMLNETESKENLIQTQIMQLNVNQQQQISRQELDASLNNLTGSSRSQWKNFLETTESENLNLKKTVEYLSDEIKRVKKFAEETSVNSASTIVHPPTPTPLPPPPPQTDPMLEQRLTTLYNDKILETKMELKAQSTNALEALQGKIVKLADEAEESKAKSAAAQKTIGNVCQELKGKLEEVETWKKEMESKLEALKEEVKGKMDDRELVDYGERIGEVEGKLSEKGSKLVGLEETIAGLVKVTDFEEIVVGLEEQMKDVKVVEEKKAEEKMEVEQKKKVEENQKQKQKQVDENEFVKVTDFEEIFDNLKTERNGDAFVADRLREELNKLKENITALTTSSSLHTSSLDKASSARDEKDEEIGLEMSVLKLRVNEAMSRVEKLEKSQSQSLASQKQPTPPQQPPQSQPQPPKLVKAPAPPPPIATKSEPVGWSTTQKQKEIEKEIEPAKPAPPAAAAAAETEEEEDEDEDLAFVDFSTDLRGALMAGPCDFVEAVKLVPPPVKRTATSTTKTTTTATTSAAATSAPTKTDLSQYPRQGDRIKARWKGLRSWFKGVCLSVNIPEIGSGDAITFHVQYDDGGIEKFVRSDWIQIDTDAVGGGVKGKEEVVVEEEVEDEELVEEEEEEEEEVFEKEPEETITEEEKALNDSVNTQFPSQIFVRRWSREQVKTWITTQVKLPQVADKFYEFKMNGEMIMDRNWTSGDMERDLSHPSEGMGIDDAQERAKISAFIKALRERDINSRNARISNYYAVWGDEEDGRGSEDSFEESD